MKYHRRCDHLTGNARAIVEYAVAAGWPRDRIDYLPNFVPDARAVASPDDAAALPVRPPVALALVCRAYEAEFTEAAVVARYRRDLDRLAPRCAASPG